MDIKNKNRNILIGVLVVIVITFLGSNKYKKANIENFEAKFFACKELELDTLYDKINGTISKKEYINEMRIHLQNYKDIKKGVPSDFKKEYEEYFKILSSNIVNYGHDVDQEKETLKLGILINKFNEVEEKRNINIDKRNKKVDKYMKEFRNK